MTTAVWIAGSRMGRVGADEVSWDEGTLIQVCLRAAVGFGDSHQWAWWWLRGVAGVQRCSRFRKSMYYIRLEDTSYIEPQARKD